MFQPQPTSFASVYFPLTPSSSSTSSSPPLVNGHAYLNRHHNAATSSSSASPATSICSDLPQQQQQQQQQQQAPPPPSYGLAPSFVSGPSLIPVGGRGAGVGAGAGPAAVAGAAIGAPSGLENETGAPAGHFPVPRPGPGAVSVCGRGLASVGAAVVADSPAQHLRHGSRRSTSLQATLPSHHPYSGPYRPARTASMASHDQHDIAAQQAAAKDYQPVLEGPLVGDKLPSDVLTQEYAKADQAFVDKTITLPQKFSHYRPVQGDGNCGWRAIGFSYFEKLIEAGDQAQIDNEVSRLLNLNQTLATMGGYNYFEDFADETIDLLREVSRNMADPNMAHTLLMQRWNDAGVTSGIIYHLRLLAATFLKSNVEAYADFIIDGTIQSYCSHSVELVNHEIEHLGLVALSNVLLKPCNFAMEVAYLDRSEGTEVNVYRFPEEAANQPDSAFASVVYLLYRPGHYDILYRAPTPPPIEAPVAPVSIQVHRVNGFTSNAAITGTQNSLGDFSNVDFSALAMIPGFGPGGAGISGLTSPATSTTLSDPFSSVQQPPNLWGPQFCSSMGAPSPQAAPQQAQAVSPAAPPNPPAPTPLSPHTTRSSSTPMSQAHVMSGTSLASAPECTIRFSPMQLEYDGSKNNYPEPTFQVTTNTFKNSVWNRAHFGNPDFHPEEWSPEDENIDGRLGPKRKGGLRREI